MTSIQQEFSLFLDSSFTIKAFEKNKVGYQSCIYELTFSSTCDILQFKQHM